jgi:hypothetical protein
LKETHLKLKRTLGLAVAIAAATMLAAPAAYADTVTSTVSGGALSVSTAGVALSAVTLNGTTQLSTGTTASWTLSDTRGTGAAWTVTASATVPTSAAGTIETVDRTIPVGNLTFTTGTIVAGTGADPITNITGSTSLALATTSQTLIASTGTNKGIYTLTPSFALSVPANAYRSNYFGAVGSTALNAYSSTVTYTIA